MACFNIRTKFRFGKYKGRAIGEVLKEDFSYVLWLQNNNDCHYHQFSREIKEILKTGPVLPSSTLNEGE